MNNEFEIRIISLLDQKERRSRIQALLRDSGYEWDFFDAISGKEVDPSLKNYDRSKRMKFPGHDLTPNEIACFLSHREVWKQCVEKNKNFVVLEDDASIIRPGFGIEYLQKLLNAIIPHMEENNVVRLGHGDYRKEYQVIRNLDADFSLVRYQRDPLCALAYVITPQVAEKLMLNSEKFFLPVDDFMWNGNESQCMVLDIEPVYFSTPVENNPSTIGLRTKRRQNILEKIKREFYRALYQRNLKINEKMMMKAALKNGE